MRKEGKGQRAYIRCNLVKMESSGVSERTFMALGFLYLSFKVPTYNIFFLGSLKIMNNFAP